MEVLFPVTINELITQVKANIDDLTTCRDASVLKAIAAVQLAGPDLAKVRDALKLDKSVTYNVLIAEYEDDLDYFDAAVAKEPSAAVKIVYLSKSEWKHYFRLQVRPEWC